jgi:hypothetical protein
VMTQAGYDVTIQPYKFKSSPRKWCNSSA